MINGTMPKIYDSFAYLKKNNQVDQMFQFYFSARYLICSYKRSESKNIQFLLNVFVVQLFLFTIKK